MSGSQSDLGQVTGSWNLPFHTSGHISFQSDLQRWLSALIVSTNSRTIIEVGKGANYEASFVILSYDRRYGRVSGGFLLSG